MHNDFLTVKPSIYTTHTWIQMWGCSENENFLYTTKWSKNIMTFILQKELSGWIFSTEVLERQDLELVL